MGRRCSALALATMLASVPAHAQQAERDFRDDRQERERAVRLSQQSPRLLIENVVIQRERPQYDLVGLPVGGLRLFPSVNMRLNYDSNVFNAPSGEGDAFVRIEPALALRSDWTRHAIELDASGAIERFAQLKANDVNTYDLRALGTLDIGRGGHVTGNAHVARAVEARGSIGDLFPGGEAITYRLHEANLGATEYYAGLLGSLGAHFAEYRYHGVTYQGVSYPQDYRDRRELTGRADLAVPISANVALFVEVDGNDVNYRNPSGTSDFSSHGGAAIGGLAFQIPRLLSGEFGVGYLRQEYDVLPLPAISGLSYDFSMVWNVTQMVTLSARSQRNVQQTPYVQAPAVIASTSTLRVDYELLRNLLVNLTFAVTDYDFGKTNRTDTLYNGSLSFHYLASRSLTADLVVEARGQKARSPFNRSYHGQAVRLGVTAQR